MINKIFFLKCALFLSTTLLAQKTELPYYEIPQAPESFTAGTIASRMVDALGFRYYWSTEGLTSKDLAYKPNEKGRTTQETIMHIYDLTNTLLKLTKVEVTQMKKKEEMDFIEIRKQTLLNLYALSIKFKNSSDVSEFNVLREGKTVVSFWNYINGPIADAIWHTGQIASFRRSSGNPINAKINHFSGTVRK